MTKPVSSCAATERTQIGDPRRTLSMATRDLRNRLRDAGLRPTRQRVALAELLFANGDRHLTAETLYEEARVTRYPPSLATIYNTLNQFASHGLVREIAVYGAKIWYDTKTGPHYHFYLEDQDELFDIPDELIPALNIPAPDGTHVCAIDVVVRLKSNRPSSAPPCS
jgi:Fur family iron response transcriptional regulator